MNAVVVSRKALNLGLATVLAVCLLACQVDAAPLLESGSSSNSNGNDDDQPKPTTAFGDPLYSFSSWQLEAPVHSMFVDDSSTAWWDAAEKPIQKRWASQVRFGKRSGAGHWASQVRFG